jgi:hypothetical protein
MADPYRSSVAPQTPAFSGASAESFGAAVGRGLEEAGDTVDRIIHREKELKRDQEATSAGVDLANASTEIDKDAIDARTTAAPGGAGHTEAITKAFEERQQAALAAISDKHIRQAFTQRWAELKDHVVTREYGWEAGQRVDKIATDFDTMGTTLANGQAGHPDPVGLQVSLSTIETAGNGLAIAADTRAKLIREQQRKVVGTFANSLVDSNPRMIVGDATNKGLLERPEFTRYLEPEDIGKLRDGAHVELRRLDAEERQRIARETADAREFVSGLGQRITGGDPTVSDADFTKGFTLAKKYDLPAAEFNLSEWKDLRDVTRETRTWTPESWHANINALTAKGDKLTAAEGIRLKHLQQLAPGAIGRFNSDPYAAAAAAGNPAPDLDPANPATAQARIQWARGYARSAGLQDVPYLSPDEIKDFRDRSAQGPTGQLEVAAQARSLFGIAAATEIVRQVDPNNRDMQIMVSLPTRMAELYRRGVEALKANTVKLGADGEDSQADVQGMRDTFAEFMPAIPVDLQPAVLNAARAMTAGRMAETGHNQLTGAELTGAFRNYIHRAGGMVGSVDEGSATGGFARVNGRYAWLPPSMSRAELGRRLARADDGAWIKAGGSPPYYLGSDGKLAKMNDKQIAHLREYQLETINPGLYRLVGPDGGHVVDQHGQPWQFDIRNLGH